MDLNGVMSALYDETNRALRISPTGLTDTFGRRLTVVMKERTAGALAVGTVANTWHDPDQSGSAAARDLDMVVPGVAIGDWVRVDLDLSSASTAAAVYIDVHTIVAGAAVHRFGGDHSPTSVGGSGSTLMLTNVAASLAGSLWYQIVSGDVESGSVRLRVRDCNATTTARSLNGIAAVPYRTVATGPF